MMDLAETPARPANIVPYEKLLNSAGVGWEESWAAGEDGDADEIDLMPCVWIDGHVMLNDGCSADARSDVWRRSYGRARGMRIWEGDVPPTEEQRQNAEWSETGPPDDAWRTKTEGIWAPDDPLDGKHSGLIAEE